MRKIGIAKEQVLTDIAKYRDQDVPWNKVLNSICTVPHDIAKSTFAQAIDTNLGDPRIFRGTQQIERKVISFIYDLLHGSLLNGELGEQGIGSLVSGGTEANLLAMYVAKKRALQKNPHLTHGEVIVAQTVHYSLQKVFDMLGLVQKTVPVDGAMKMDVSLVESLINDNTIAIVGTAGSSEFGAIDPIEALSDIAVAHDMYLHVDAATGGFIIPFANELGYGLPKFDFALAGVCSITMDPHKYGLVNIPAGGIFFKNEELHQNISLDSFFIGTPTHRTFLGTRPGGAAVATYAVMEHLGWDGFIDVTRANYETMEYLVANIMAMGLQLLTPPQLNIVIINLDNAKEVMTLLESWDWIISVSTRFHHCLRLVITCHVDIPMIDEFLAVLEKALSTLEANSVDAQHEISQEIG